MAILEKVFKAAVDYKASDVHVVPNEPIMLRQLGRLRKLKNAPLTPDQCKKYVYEILSPEQRKKLEENLQLDFAIEVPELGRFRGSTMMHNRGLSATFRIIPPHIPSLEELGLPPIVEKILDNHQGLILVTGATGQGKSTTLAAMVDYINSNRAHHVLTIEDPIEFVHPLKKCAINQRQIGSDTHSYANALKSALREDPDVIMIGELRDLDTISMAITAAETGHLVIGTLATSSAPKTVDRVIDAYPPSEQNQIRAMLAESLRAIITQRLVPSLDNTRMVLAVEILIGTLPMVNLIRDGKTFQLPNMMQTGKKDGMQDMDDALFNLMQEGQISAGSAYALANKPQRFKTHLDKESKSLKTETDAATKSNP
jgi:twitching motility protein PilT